MEMKIKAMVRGLSIMVLLVCLNSLEAEAGVSCVGSSHTCFINSKKELRCWGSNTFGENGQPDMISTSEYYGQRLTSSLANDTKEVVCGDNFTCFSTIENKVYCFGKNDDFQLGRSSANFSPNFFSLSNSQVSLPTPTSKGIQISGMGDYVCALVDSSIYCWGLRSIDSYVGKTVTQVSGIAGLTPTQISVGPDHACFVDASFNAYCWGLNSKGQLGVALTDNSVINPTKVALTSQVSYIAVGADHTCVTFKSSGKVGCFGNNEAYQLGDMTNINRGSTQSSMNTIESSTMLGTGTPFLGNQVTCVVSASDNGLYCIGSAKTPIFCSFNTTVALGSQTTDYPPNHKLVTAFKSGQSMAIGNGKHYCVTDGTDIYCWGSNEFYQLGSDNKKDVKTCTENTPLTKVCFSSSCTVQEKPSGLDASIIILIVTFSIAIFIILATFGVLICYGWKKRNEFNNRPFGHPNGGTVTGLQMFNSYKHPLGPPLDPTRNVSSPNSVFAVSPKV